MPIIASSEKQIIKRVFVAIRPYKLLFFISVICMMVASALSAAQAYMFKPLIDKIFVAQDKFFLNLLPLLLVTIFVAKGFFDYSYKVILEKIGQGVICDMREQIFSHIHSLPIAFFHKTSTGELISRVISDIALIQVAISTALIGLFKNAIQAVGMIGVIFFLNWKLASFSIIFMPIAVIPIIIFGRLHRRYSYQAQQTMAKISSILHESIFGNRIVKAFCMEKHETNRFAKAVRNLYSIMIKDAKVRSLSSSLMELMGGIFIAFIIWYGGHEVLKDQSTPGTFFAFMAALVMTYEPIKGISRVNSTVQQGLAAAIRVFTILDTKPEITDQPGAMAIPPMQKNLEFKNISFSYDNKVKVLDRINLTVSNGEVIAIVGTSGAGKTSLVNLIPRFFEVTSGQLLFDGQDIRDITISSLRGQIAMVTQQTILFNDSIRNNIAYGEPNRPEEDIVEAARAAHALDFIKQLPDGFETVIGESGAKLSGGQQQRISIARAILKDAPILILDEATSALDTESEREVQKALDNLMKNRTTFVIAHRLSTIRNADRIIVMQAGRIIEEGSHDRLLENNGVYGVLHNMQH